MGDAADLVLANAEIHTLGEPDAVHEAVAVDGGAIRRLGSSRVVEKLVGVETTVVDLPGCVVLPGFIDAHTHLLILGRYLVHADLREAEGAEECIERLRASAESRAESDRTGIGGWVLGFGFDESGWSDQRFLDREDLDAVSETRPVAAFREDMHVAAVNGVALDQHADAMPEADLRTEGGEPTGVLVEAAVDVIYQAIEPDREAAEALLRAAQVEANRRGVTGVHDMVRRSHAPAVYRALERSGELTLRVRLNYWADHLDALLESGLRTNDGSGMVRVGAVKTYVDGSIGGRTARVSEPYVDGDGVGQWVVPPDDLASLVERADDAGFQIAAHAIGDDAIDATLDAFERSDASADARHRVEHAEMTDDAAVERFATLGVVASMQPNFLKWASPGGLYERRLGPERGAATNRYCDLLAAGVPLAFGSDCMPLDPLFGVHQAITHPTESQRLTVTEALRAYTRGGAVAGFDEDRLGGIDEGHRADLVALSDSPWEGATAIDDIGVAMTVVDGEIVYDGR